MEQATADRGPGGAASLPPGEQHAVTTSDGTEIRLTHYAMGTKGPIVLAPGYGNAARAFAVDTVPKNYVQYLGEHGYDVWLLDYRASPDLEASRTQFTVDDIAMRDWPAAIDAVRQRDRRGLGPGHGPLRRRPVAVHGHRRRPARACARRPSPSLAGHPIPTPGNQRARRRAPGDAVQARSGIKGLNTDYDPEYAARPRGRARDAARCPFRHVYDNPVGRRIYFVYGDVFDYENINEATMDEAVPSFFGIGNITFFEHISLMIRAERGAATRAAEDAYLANLDALPHADHFITGEHNRMFVPQGPAAHATTRCARPTGPSATRHHVIKDYAHLDCGWARTPSATSSRPPSPSWSANS